MMAVRDRSDVFKLYSPKFWGYANKNPEKAFTAESPTIYEVGEFFGHEISVSWIMTQVTALYHASASTDENMSDGIRQFSECFATEVKQYKLSELLLFFARYQAGRYDETWSTFNPRRIGYSFFHDFLEERNNELAAIEIRLSKEKALKNVSGGITYTEYQELKKRAEAGDEEAKRRLRPPKE
jgi:hypothetical protein